MSTQRHRPAQRWRAGWHCLAGGVLAVLGLAGGSAPADADCLPFDMAPTSAYLNGPHRVLAHYFNRFPLSIDNRPADRDYYATQYLQPEGERGKWAAQGGYLRSRPLAVTPGSPWGYRRENMKREVEMALSRGIGGFTFDVLGEDDLRSGGPLDDLLSAVASAAPGFAVVLMPDMASLGEDMENFTRVVRRAYEYSGLYRTPEGRLLVAPFLAERVKPEDWGIALAKLEGSGIHVALLPTFLSFDPGRASALRANAFGFGTFATPVRAEAAGIRNGTETSHAMGKLYMAGIPTQGYRPKDMLYWESEGSASFRASWEAAIQAGADWVQVTTWNDFSESTQLAPYTDGSDGIGTGFFDLNAYYATWMVTGSPPAIRRDAIYYFYRRQRVSERGERDTGEVRNAVPGEAGMDQIEAVALLRKPATLQIVTSGGTQSISLPGGLHAVHVALAPGHPVFRLMRPEGADEWMGVTTVSDSHDFHRAHADLTYWGGGGVLSTDCPADRQAALGTP